MLKKKKIFNRKTSHEMALNICGNNLPEPFLPLEIQTNIVFENKNVSQNITIQK